MATVRISINPSDGKSRKLFRYQKFKQRNLENGLLIVGPYLKNQFQTAIKKSLSRRKNVAANSRTGNLIRSIKWAFRRIATGPTLKVGSDARVAPYGRIREFGGRIRARRAKFLTIPFPGITGKAREYKDTFFKTSSSGSLILFQSLGAGKIRPLFLLKKSVFHPRQPWLRPTWKRRKRRVYKFIAAELNRPLKGKR